MDIECGLIHLSTPRSVFFLCRIFHYCKKNWEKNYFVTRFLFLFLIPKTLLFWVNVVSFLFVAIIDSQTTKGFYFILVTSRKRLPFIAKSLFTNDTIVEN